MSGLAQRIRQAREAGNITIEQAERTTRIRSRYLRFIEDGDFAQLPDGPAGRGFIKNYTRFLGLDPEEALSQFEAEFGVPVMQIRDEVPPPPERIPQQSEYTRVAHPNLTWKGNLPNPDQTALDDEILSDDDDTAVTVPEISGIDGATGRVVVIRPREKLRASRSSFRLRGERASDANNVPEKRRRTSGRPSIYRIDKALFPERSPVGPIITTVATVTLVALAAFVGFPAARRAGWFTPAPTATPIKVLETPIAAEATVVRVTVVSPEAAGPGDAIATPDPNEARTNDVQVSAAPDGGFQLALDAREQAFIKIVIDGNLVFQGLPQLGLNPTWSASRSLVIETGNAGAFDVI
ncbi:MAG: helix-turn-helix transcriptional regulator, partial [Chloroflexi bacterium]|nr:helix-turn-helix transcriptional regulator [Chloroflexota bacterium]